MMIPADLHTLWAETLMRHLAAAGVEEAVISPGSRSTPLTLAALREPGLRCHALLDERCAGFFALGMARLSGRPPVLICTSGTAGAHYAPAVIEAAESGLALLILTADRPPELQQRRAPQTTEQRGMFGLHARAFFDLGVPRPEVEALAGVAATAALACALALDPRPGPVHLNLPFAKPLEPQPGNQADRDLREQAASRLAAPPVRFHPAQRHPDPGAVREAAAQLRQSRRGVILCGPGPLSQRAALPALRALAARLGYPVLAEAGSQFAFLTPAERPALAVFPWTDLVPGTAPAADLRPDLILQAGSVPTSSAWNEYLASATAPPRLVLAPGGWNDPHNNARWIVASDLTPAFEALGAAPGLPDPLEGWAARWQAAALREPLPWGEAGAAQVVLDHLPPGSLLAIGNSLSIREVERCLPPPAGVAGVLGQRGVNGIDGNIAAAAGAAVKSGRPVTLITGDLAAQHDLGGLAAARLAGNLLRIVVLDNGGGRLFEKLPLARCGLDPAWFRDFFLTPQNLDFAAAARAFGIEFREAFDPESLRAACQAPAGAGPRLIRVRLCAG